MFLEWTTNQNMNDLHSIFLDLREHCYSGKSQKLTGTSAHTESDNGSGKISFLRTARGIAQF